MAIPLNSALIGVELDTAFVVVDLTAPDGIGFISNTVCVSIAAGQRPAGRVSSFRSSPSRPWF